MRAVPDPGRRAGKQTGREPNRSAEASAWDSAVSSVGGDHFRPDIEGLRAVAILAVLAFHARIPLLQGGFIGVDVFFVISGYLITGLLLRELRSSGRIDLRRFYARRARRLLPAALVVIVATLVASWFLLPVIDFPDVARDGAAAAVYISNYRFALVATDYFAAQSAPSPLLHYWSLGVEEQFYLFWPLLLLVATRLWAVGRLWAVALGIAVASFALSFWITQVDAPWAFYSLPTRAWQLALGALAALGILALPARWPSMVAAAVTALGLGLIGAGVLLITPSTPFPGIAALLPAAGSALVIVGGERHRTFFGRALATPVPRWFGRISYSLYLWHWPILILGPLLIGHGGILLRIALALVAIGVAALSTWFIETPFRVGGGSRLPSGRTLVFAGSSSLAVALAAVLVSGSLFAAPIADVPRPSLPASGDPQPALLQPDLSGPIPDGLRPTLAQARDDRGPIGQETCVTLILETEPDPCVVGDPSATTTVVLYGDSHAAMWLPALELMAADRHWRVVPVIKVACPPFDVSVWRPSLDRALTECDRWRPLAMDLIAREHPAIVFVAGSRNYQLVDPQGRPLPTNAYAGWEPGMLRTLAALRALAQRVVLIGESPHFHFDPPRCLATAGRIEACTVPRRRIVSAAYAALERSTTEATGTDLIPTIPWLCQKESCPLILGDYLVYRNNGHLTATITTVLAQQLSWAFDRLR
jgi:peptidoglycan/LPS O-acetylase OafA/YrhL